MVAYSWVSISADHWRDGLQEVLDWRAWMRDSCGVPKNYELHMTKFADESGNPSTRDEDWNRSKANRSLVLDETFAHFGKWSWLGSGTIFARTNAKRQAFRDERERVYRELVGTLEHELASAEEWGLIYMDGVMEPIKSIGGHIAISRLNADGRRILEDPSFQHSHLSQWIQIADIVAYAAYQYVLELPEKRFAWKWWPMLDPAGARTHDVS